MAVVIVLALFALAMWLLSFVGIGLTSFLDDVIGWLSAHSPLPDALAPSFVFPVLFIAVRAAAAPYLLTHARIDRAKAKIKLWYEKAEGPSGRAIACCLLIGAAEAAALLMVARAVEQGSHHWAESTLWLLPSIGWLGNCLLSAGALVLDAVLGSGATHCAAAAFERLTGRDTSGARAGFLSPHNTERTLLVGAAREEEGLPEGLPVLALVLLSDLYVYLPAFVLMSLLYHTAPFLPTMFFCFVLVKILTTGLIEFISLFLDRRNNLWVQDLRDEARQDPDPAHRRAAADLLAKLPDWAKDV